MIRALDWMADWLRHELGPQWQLRIGVLCCLGSLPLMAFGVVLGGGALQFLIYEMSAFALLIGGLSFVVSAEVLVDRDNEQGDQP